jgi:hypothetical protein
MDMARANALTSCRGRIEVGLAAELPQVVASTHPSREGIDDAALP